VNEGSLRVLDPVPTPVRCRECRFFDPAGPACRAGGRSPLRNCVIAINQAFVEMLRPGDRVLEIGCGSWSYVLDRLPPGVVWQGIDVVAEYEDQRSVATVLGSVAAVPFAAGSFDYVLTNQSIEHWFEYGVTLHTGMAEIARVLKPGGQAWVNVPVHLHGHRLFVAGDHGEIARALLGTGAFEPERLEHWRREHAPLERYAGWGISNDLELEFLIPEAALASSWILNAVLRKVREPATGARHAAAQRLVRAAFRLPAGAALLRAANRGPRFMAHKLWRRLGGQARPVARLTGDGT
jgi:SAM-dependent methyltransferase